MADGSGKTEEPTQRRLEKARKEGQFPSAREFVSALQFTVFLALLGAGGAEWIRGFAQTMRSIFAFAFAGDFSVEDLSALAGRVMWRQFMPLAAAGGIIAAATVALRLVTTRFGFSLKKLSPDLGRLNPFSKLKDLPRQNWG